MITRIAVLLLIGIGAWAQGAAPERFAAEAPYQVVIVDLDGGGRTTVRMEGARVAIGDRVTETAAGTFTKDI